MTGGRASGSSRARAPFVLTVWATDVDLDNVTIHRRGPKRLCGRTGAFRTPAATPTPGSQCPVFPWFQAMRECYDRLGVVAVQNRTVTRGMKSRYGQRNPPSNCSSRSGAGGLVMCSSKPASSGRLDVGVLAISTQRHKSDRIAFELAAHQARQLVPAHHRQSKVDEREVGLHPFDQRSTLFAVFRREHPHAHRFEEDLHHPPRVGLILDDHHGPHAIAARRHGRRARRWPAAGAR